MKVRKPPTPEEAARIRHLHKVEGLTQAQLAVRFNLAPASVRRVLARNKKKVCVREND